MVSISPPPTIYLHSGATGMRKSFDGPSGIIRDSLGGDRADGSLFLFVNKRRDRIKALWWDGLGFSRTRDLGVAHLFLNPHITWHRKSNPVTGRRSIGNGAEAQAIPAHPHLKNPLPAKIALAHWEEGVYVAGMTKELVFPNDLAACHAINRDQAERVARLQAEREAALQLAFHKKIERYLPDPEQFVLDLGDSPGVVDAAEGIADATLETVAGYERRKQATEKARSEQLPAHLPRYEVKLDVPEDQKTCA